MPNFMKVFESADSARLRGSGLLAALGRMMAFCLVGLLFVLTVYTLW